MLQPKKQAILAILLSATIISSSGLLVRVLEGASEWQIVFWRSLSLVAVLLSVLVVRYRSGLAKEFINIGISGLIGSFFGAGALVCYVLAITNTTVANAVFTMSSVPFFTAFFAWIILGERVTAQTLLAIVIAFGGIGLMVSDGIASGTLLGNLMALVAAICIAGFVVSLRNGREINMLPCALIAALISTVLAGGMAQGDVQVSTYDLYVCLTLGSIILGVSVLLFLFASRGLSGAELTLLNLVEYILGPLWVWIFIHEIPGDLTLMGGGIVLFAVSVHGIILSRTPPVVSG